MAPCMHYWCVISVLSQLLSQYTAINRPGITTISALDLASFPGPAQLFIACSTEKRGVRSFVQPKAARGPGNEATLDPISMYNIHGRLSGIAIAYL